MKEYTEKEKFEKRFQYSLAMAGILIIAGLSLYGFIDQQQVNIQQVLEISPQSWIFHSFSMN